MNFEFRKLSNNDLTLKVKTLVEQERKLTANILEHISEIDRRRLFLDLSHPSLFEYLVKEIGYSAGAAQRRIDASRLSQRIPEIARKIESGVLNLNQISKFSQACRMKKKQTGQIITVTSQREILQKIESGSPQRTEFILAQEFGFEVVTQASQKVQADESVQINMNFTRAEFEILRQAQALFSNKTGGDLKGTLLYVTEMAVARGKDKSKQKILDRDQECQHVDKTTGEKCSAKYFLEIDHIVPKFAGGSNDESNLRVLCRSHNQQRYRRGINVKNCQ